MNLLQNIDLLAVGISSVSIFILGFSAYITNRKSVTNRVFFWFSIVTAAWSAVNYLSYHFSNGSLALWFTRGVLFFAVFQAYYLYEIFQVFPDETFVFSKNHQNILRPLVFLTALLTLTPLVFSSSVGAVEAGNVAIFQKGPGLIFFALIAVSLVVRAVYTLIRKIRAAKNDTRFGLTAMLAGVLIMFALIIALNLFAPNIWGDTRFVPFAGIFTLPFIILTAYAIYRHKLFNIKVATTAFLTIFLSVVSVIDLVSAADVGSFIVRAVILMIVITVSTILIRGVLREIEQRERLQILSDQLAVANDKLKDLDKLKTEFLSLASHQLRSPLTAIKGYTSMLLDGSYGAFNAEQKEAIDRVFQSSNHLTKVVEDLLNVTKIEQGGMKYEMAPFDIGKSAHEIADDLSITAKKKDLELTFHTDGAPAYMVNGDMEKLRQVIINLIDNSIKYTQKGFIRVGVERTHPDKVLVSITDSGMGMTPEIKATLFQKFARGEGGKVNSGGSGLGLYLAKEITEAHKGRVWVDSPGKGLGATFYVELDEYKA